MCVWDIDRRRRLDFSKARGKFKTIAICAWLYTMRYNYIRRAMQHTTRRVYIGDLNLKWSCVCSEIDIEVLRFFFFFVSPSYCNTKESLRGYVVVVDMW